MHEEILELSKIIKYDDKTFHLKGKHLVDISINSFNDAFNFLNR